jgi:hypothetical protein
MKQILLLFAAIGLLVALGGCQPESGSADYSAQVSKETPKNTQSNEPDMPPPPGIKIGADRGGAKGTGPTAPAGGGK